MQNCTACQKATASVHVMDLKDGSVVETQFLCRPCADQKGVLRPGDDPISELSAEKLEQLLGPLQAANAAKTSAMSGPSGKIQLTVCPGCHLTAAEFKLRHRLGCARCYEVFRDALVPILERVHDAIQHRGRFPGSRPLDGDDSSTEPSQRPDTAEQTQLNELRSRLGRAIANEHYEEAAKLRDHLRRALDESQDGSGTR